MHYDNLPNATVAIFVMFQEAERESGSYVENIDIVCDSNFSPSDY
jgi:hypothetical protein